MAKEQYLQQLWHIEGSKKHNELVEKKNYLMEEKIIITFSFITYHLQGIPLFHSLFILMKFRKHRAQKKLP